MNDEGTDNVYRDNLLVSMLFPGTYNGAQETQNLDWYGAFNLNKATSPVLENNVVAGVCMCVCVKVLTQNIEFVYTLHT